VHWKYEDRAVQEKMGQFDFYISSTVIFRTFFSELYSRPSFYMSFAFLRNHAYVI
jgi:hypothetical protein